MLGGVVENRTFSALFEERHLPVHEVGPFGSNSAMQTVHGIPMPVYRSFQMLKGAGDVVLPVLVKSSGGAFNQSGPLSVMATVNETDDGTLRIFLSNFCRQNGGAAIDPSGNATTLSNETKTVHLTVSRHVAACRVAAAATKNTSAALVRTINSTCANPKGAWIREMGSVPWPTPSQLDILRAASQMCEHAVPLQWRDAAIAANKQEATFTIELEAYAVVEVSIGSTRCSSAAREMEAGYFSGRAATPSILESPAVREHDNGAAFHHHQRNNWTLLNNSDIGTQWNPALVRAPCEAPHGDCSSTLELCAAWCENTTGCAAVSWNGPQSHWGKKGKIGCNFKCNSARGSVWKGSVPGEGLAILIADTNMCGVMPPPPTPSPPPPPAPPPPPPRPQGPAPPRRVRWYTNVCCDRLWTHDIAAGGALDPAASTKFGPIATGVYTSGWPPAFQYVRNVTHPHMSSIQIGSLGPPTGNSSSLPMNGQGCDNSSNAQHCWSYDLPYLKNYTSTIHTMGLDVYAGINEIDFDYFPGAPNVTVAHVQTVAMHTAASVKEAGFDGAIADYEPAWVPDKQAYIRWIRIMVDAFRMLGLQFSANVGADFDGGTLYADFAASGVDTMAMMDPTYNGVNASLHADRAAVTQIVAAEHTRGQASCGVGANLEPGEPGGDCRYFWNAAKFTSFVNFVIDSSGLVEISVFPAGMSSYSTSGVAGYYRDGLRRFLNSTAPPLPNA
jgi:hypothetical protein